MATALSAGLPPAWMLARTLSSQLHRRGGPVLLMRLGALPKHGDVIVCATTACLRARLRTAPIRSRERQRADAQLLMTFCLAPEADRASSLARLPMTWPNPGSSIHFRSDFAETRQFGRASLSRTMRSRERQRAVAGQTPMLPLSYVRGPCLTYSYARFLSVGRSFNESLTSPSRTGCATRKWRSRNASAQSSVGAKANSPRREPWENCDVHQAPARGESRGSALFRPLRGLFRSRLVPTACAVGYWLSP